MMSIRALAASYPSHLDPGWARGEGGWSPSDQKLREMKKRRKERYIAINDYFRNYRYLGSN